MAELEPTVRDEGAGRFLFRRFLLVRVLGRGASGPVWLARDSDLELEVALKLIGEVSVRDEHAAAQLREEARLCLRLSHPHIVRIHSYHQEGPRAAISMEYVDGETLHAWRASHPMRRLAPEELAGPVRQLVSAMDYAHERVGVLHLDLKPANLMLDAAGDLRVLDFGIGRTRAAPHAAAAPAGGSLGYMSPQRRRGEGATVADDLYSAGALLFELLTGLPPSERGGVARVNEALRAMGAVEEVPPAWEDAVAACLEEDPRKRPASFAELAAAIGLSEAASAAEGRPSQRPPDAGAGERDEGQSFALLRKIPKALERWGARREGRPCWESALDYADAAYRMLSAGEALTAYEIVLDGLRWFPGDAALGRLLGIALIRLGRPREARRHLEGLRPPRPEAEFSAVLGKAMLQEALSLRGAEAELLAGEALAELETAAAESADLLVPMEAMAAAALSGATARAKLFAEAVAMREEQERAGWFEPTPGRFPEGWRPFAAGLGALVSGGIALAEPYFAESRNSWGAALHDLAEARRLLAAVAARLGLDEGVADRLLPMPGVAVAVGHMFDRPDRPSPRFPRSREGEVRGRLSEFIEGEGIGCGFASGACGADVLFHEELHRRGLPSHLVLPLPLSEPGQLGGIVHGPEDEARLMRVAEACSSVVATSRFDSGDDEVESAYCLACLLGLAGLHAASIGAKLRPLAVWDGRAGDRRGGTADMVAYWRSLGLPVEVVALGEGLADGSPAGFAELPAKIRGILAMRAPDYASRPDRGLAEFADRVLPLVVESLAEGVGVEILEDGSAGAVTALFPRPSEAAAAAVEVSERLRGLSGLAGLEHPEAGILRCSLHAGPVGRSGAGAAMGSHLNLARSIAPPGGRLYATEPFAALLHIEAPRRFPLRYAGLSWVANGFGPRPLYELCQEKTPE